MRASSWYRERKLADAALAAGAAFGCGESDSFAPASSAASGGALKFVAAAATVALGIVYFLLR